MPTSLNLFCTILCFLFFHLSIFCQSKSFVDYNEKKYLAESLIIDGAQCNAAEIYKDLANDHHLWFNDMHNALLVGLMCDDSELCDTITSRFLIGDYSAKRLEKFYSDFDYFKSRSWNEIKKEEVTPVYNSDVREAIERMYKRDQDNRYDVPSRMRNDVENLIELQDIMNKYGFPTERELGYTDNNDSLDYNQMLELTLIHLCKLFPFQMGELLTKEYYNQNIQASDFIYLMALTRTCDDTQLTCFPGPPASNALFLDDVLFSCNEEEIQRINKNRAIYHLDSVEDQLAKVRFRKDSKYTWYLDDGFATYNYNRNKKTFEIVKHELESNGLKAYEW